MDEIFFNNYKVSKHKSGMFEHAQSMSKWPAGLVYIGNFINYLLYLPDPFQKGLGIGLEESSTFLLLTLLMYINRLGLFNHLYGTLFICITMCKGCWIGATDLCMEIERYYTIAVSV